MKVFNRKIIAATIALYFSLSGAGHSAWAKEKTTFMTLDPGHFHAALVQKSHYPQLNKQVYIFAPEGEDLNLHLQRIERFNSRAQSPTQWKSQVYRGQDYLQQMFKQKPGNVVVLAGSSKNKMNYILRSLESAINVYADKPMAINSQQFEHLKSAFKLAKKNQVILWDIMTERFEITSVLQKEISQIAEIFGQLEKGSTGNPAIIKESVHHYSKTVSGKPLQRPPWFFDEDQEGDGLVDVTTHLVDLVQWGAFPGETIDYQQDIKLDSATRWPTLLKADQFFKVSKTKAIPDYLKKNYRKGTLSVFSNGEINYRIKGIHARVKVSWEFQAPAGGGDTHYSLMQGSKSNLIIRQGKEQNYKPELYIEPRKNSKLNKVQLEQALSKIARLYPGLHVVENRKGWQVSIPEKYRLGHEAHFAQVTKKYLSYLESKSLPEQEIANTLAKYYTTTKALEIAIKP